MLLPGSASLWSGDFSLASRRMQSSEQSPVQTRGCPTFCKRLPLNHLHQTVWLYFWYCNTAVHNLSSASRTLAKYSSCIIGFLLLIEGSRYKLLSLLSLENTQTLHKAECDAFRTTSAKCQSNVLTRVVFLRICQSSFYWEDTWEMLSTHHFWAHFWVWSILFSWLWIHSKREVIFWWLVGTQQNLEKQQYLCKG